MDAILEYTSMSRLPGVFLEDGQPAAINPTLQSTEMLTLPQRMEGNRLHRFSKVQKIVKLYLPLRFTVQKSNHFLV